MRQRSAASVAALFHVTDMSAGASAAEQLIVGYPDRKLHVLVVWEPILSTNLIRFVGEHEFEALFSAAAGSLLNLNLFGFEPGFDQPTSAVVRAAENFPEILNSPAASEEPFRDGEFVRACLTVNGSENW